MSLAEKSREARACLTKQEQQAIDQELRELFLIPDTAGIVDVAHYISFSQAYEVLLRGADPFALQSQKNENLLHIAVDSGWGIDAVDSILAFGFDIDAATTDGDTAFLKACGRYEPDSEALAFHLWEEGADIFAYNHVQGATSLVNASRTGWWRLSNALRQAGVASKTEPIRQDGGEGLGITELFSCIKAKSSLPVLVQAIKHCDNLDEVVRGEMGRNALCQAVMSNQMEKLGLLLDGGANIFAPTRAGSANDYVSGRGSPQVKRVFEQLRRSPGLPFDFGEEDYSEKEKFPDILWKIEHHNLAMLDNPAVWRRWEEVLRVMAEDGHTIALEHLCEKNHEGKMWLRRGIECFSAQAILSGLAEQGEHLSKEIVFDEADNGTTLLDSIVAWSDIGVIWEALERDGTPWKQDDWLRTGKDGKTMLAKAIAAGGMMCVEQWCEEHDVDFCELLLQDESGHALHAMGEMQEITYLVQDQRWMDFEFSNIRQVLQEIPAEMRWQIPEIGLLVSEIQDHEEGKSQALGR